MDRSRLAAIEDRAAISELVHSYAQAVDRKDAEGAAGLFAPDGELVVYPVAGGVTPSTLKGREQIAHALAGLDRYRATFHEVSSQTVELGEDTAATRTACVAHHVTGADGEERDRAWYLHYEDTFRRGPEGWRIARRELRIEFVKESPLDLP